MLNKDDIIKYLKILNQELEKAGVKGEMLLCGGASMCLVHSAREMTKDIDALYEPKMTINEIVKNVSKTHGLNEDWLNDSVKGFFSNNIEKQEYMKLSNLTINTVSTEYLLAMKLYSSRIDTKDLHDIDYLIDKLNINTTKEVYDLLEKYYDKHMILPRTQYIVEDIINKRQNNFIKNNIIKTYSNEFPAIKHISDDTAIKIYNLNKNNPLGIDYSIKELEQLYKQVGKKAEQGIIKTDNEYFNILSDIYNDIKRATHIEYNNKIKQNEKVNIKINDLEL